MDLKPSATEKTFASLTLTEMTKGSVLFAGAGGVISQDSAFTWEKASNYLTIQNLKIGGSAKLTAVTPNANHGLTLNAKGTSGVYFNYVDGGSGGVYFYNGITQKLFWFGGSTHGEFRGYDEDYQEWVTFSCSSGYGNLEVAGSGTPRALLLNNNAHSDVWVFQGSISGETKGLRVYGYKAGDAKRYLDITTGGTADDTVDFTGVSNYKFGGAGEFTGLTITGNSVFGLNSSVFQPGTDSTTFFQVLDADGGTPIFNVDTIKEFVGFGTAAPNAPVEVKGVKPGVVGGHQSGQLQVTGAGGEFYCAVITGHNAFNGNTQLWYLGSTSSSTHDDIAFINRQNAAIHFYTNNTSRMTIDAAGTITGLSTAAFEGASVTVGKASTTTGTLILHDSNSANTITLTVPDISAGSLSFTLPPTDGDNLDVLQTNGSGVLTWVAPAGGGGGYTDKGDLAGTTFTQAILTMDNTWRDLDLSAAIGTNAVLVHLRINIEDNVVGARVMFRENGNSNPFNIATVRVHVSNGYNHADVWVVSDSDGKIEYKATAAMDVIQGTVVGTFPLA